MLTTVVTAGLLGSVPLMNLLGSTVSPPGSLKLAGASAQEGGEQLAGSWSGAIEIPGQPLEISATFSKDDAGAWSGKMSIPAQGAEDLVLDELSFDGGQVTFRIDAIPGGPTFTGSFVEDGLKGTFAQHDVKFPFVLERAGAARDAAATLNGLDEVLLAALEDHRVPSIGVAVVYRGEVLMAQGFGMRDVEGAKPATADTLYSIGSSTKAFTAFALGTLVAEGRLAWDQPVKEVLPDFGLFDEYAEDHMTVHDLLTHRSGLPRHDLAWYVAPDATRTELLAAMDYMEPNARLGERFQYQNFMYMTAGMVVEAVTGTTYEEYVDEAILTALGMERTVFQTPASIGAVGESDEALPYNLEGKEIALTDFYNITAMGPAGSIRSSATEMAHWVQMLLDGGEWEGEALLPESILRLQMSNHSSLAQYPRRTDIVSAGYGMGWFVESYKGHYYVQHGGNINGFSAMVALFPLDELGIVVLANRNATGLPAKVAHVIADRVLGLESEDWLAVAKPDAAGAEDESAEGEADGEDPEVETDGQRIPDTRPARALSQYAGAYGHPAYGQLTVKLQPAADGKAESLTIQTGDEIRPLTHWHYEVFRAAGDDLPPNLEDLDLHFVDDARGRVVALEIALEPSIDPIRFEQLPDSTMLDPDFLDRFVGSYEVAPGVLIKVIRRAQTLALSQAGSPYFDLVPLEGTSFGIEEMKGFTLVFELGDEGPAPSLTAHQPGATTACKRVDE